MSSKGLGKKWEFLILTSIKVTTQMMITLQAAEVQALCRRKLQSPMVRLLRLPNRATVRSHRCRLRIRKKRIRKILPKKNKLKKNPHLRMKRPQLKLLEKLVFLISFENKLKKEKLF